MSEEIKQIGGGLLPLKKDNRDFQLGSIFSPIDIDDISSADFVVAEPLEIKEQYDSDMCVAFAACAVSEDQEDVVLGPEWFFSQIKKIIGDWRSWGVDLRSACKAAVNVGFIKNEFQNYNLQNKDRDFLANWENWQEELKNNASLYRKKSYFSIDNLGKDTFDSFRIALWQHKNEKCSILTGAIWEKEWTQAEGGIIPKDPGTKLFGHALKIFGQKNIGDELYLMAQLSNGTDIGDNGIFYFSREVINRSFTNGAFMFIDIDSSKVKKEFWNCKTKIRDFIIKTFKIWQ
jgi:hypothetical protein